jgi:diphthamide synthase (EF-2-diphthine--ammonia ligase)
MSISCWQRVATAPRYHGVVEVIGGRLHRPVAAQTTEQAADAAALLRSLNRPGSCGENGEFHGFAIDGPNFRQPVSFAIGKIACRESFWFCDLTPLS